MVSCPADWTFSLRLEALAHIALPYRCTPSVIPIDNSRPPSSKLALDLVNDYSSDLHYM